MQLLERKANFFCKFYRCVSVIPQSPVRNAAARTIKTVNFPETLTTAVSKWRLTSEHIMNYVRSMFIPGGSHGSCCLGGGRRTCVYHPVHRHDCGLGQRALIDIVLGAVTVGNRRPVRSPQEVWDRAASAVDTQASSSQDHLKPRGIDRGFAPAPIPAGQFRGNHIHGARLRPSASALCLFAA